MNVSELTKKLQQIQELKQKQSDAAAKIERITDAVNKVVEKYAKINVSAR